MLLHLITEAVRGAAADIPDPLTGVKPTFTGFGTFDTLWKKVLGVIWGLGLVVTVGFLIRGVVSYARAEGVHPTQMRDAKQEATRAGIAFAGLVALGAIVSAVIKVFTV
jgi:Type IV secretion system pilin